MDLKISASESYLSSLLNAAYEGLHIYWLNKNHQVLLCNVTQARYLGFNNQKEIYGMSMMDIAKLCGQNFEQIKKIEANNIQIMTTLCPTIFEERFDQAGETAIFLSYKAPFLHEDGSVQGVFGISTNITASKKAELALEQSKHAVDVYLESILMSSPSNIYWLDKEGRSLGYNDQQVKHLGMKSRTQAIGKTIFDVAAMLGWDPEMAKKIREHDIVVMESRQPSIHREVVKLNGEEKTFIASKSPMFDTDGEVIGILGISTDITEQAKIEKDLAVAKEKAEASNRAKTQFISNISHDIRTPLVGIQGIASWLLEKVPQEFHQEVEAIVRSNDELLRLLNNVINLSKLEDDEKNALKAEPFDLQQLVNKLIDLFAPVAKQKGLILQSEYAHEIPKTFVSDPLLIQRSILNLISNALKFTERGKVVVRVLRDDSDPSTDDTGFPVCIIVEDTGIGIPPEAQSEIFESFYRVTPSYRGKYRGSGLGLSIVERFVNKMGGKVGVDSEVGKGSRFFINLYLKLADRNDSVTLDDLDDYAADQAAAFENKISPLQLKITQEIGLPFAKILLVEDNPLIQKGVVHTLNKLHCFVDVAGTALQALEKIKFNHYDLIFLDIGLPDYDGLWVCQQIRALSTSQSQIPIIALTAHEDAEYTQVCLKAGMNSILSKPLTPADAKTCLERYRSQDKKI
jgi:two-component system, OmpR family, aerobic respiration control sensor histidine kinase ArcB